MHQSRWCMVFLYGYQYLFYRAKAGKFELGFFWPGRVTTISFGCVALLYILFLTGQKCQALKYLLPAYDLIKQLTVFFLLLS